MKELENVNSEYIIINSTGMNLRKQVECKEDSSFKWVRCPKCACTIQYEHIDIHRQEIVCPVCDKLFIMDNESNEVLV